MTNPTAGRRPTTVAAPATATPATTASRWRTSALGAGTLALVLALALALIPAGAVEANEPPAEVDEPSDEPPAQAAEAPAHHRLLVLWEDHADEATRAAVLADIGVRGTPAGNLDTVTVDADRAGELAAIGRRLSAREDVAAAEPDRVVRLAQAPSVRPNDPLYGEQWGLENIGQLLLADGNRSTVGVDIRARAAWDITEGNASVTVAIVDSGIDITHEDLRDGIWTNPGESRDGADSDGNGFVDDVNGWDFVRDAPIDLGVSGDIVRESHGTQVAGVLAARSRNGIGISGVAPQVSVMPVRAFEQLMPGGAGSSDLGTIVKAINYAVDNGADLINASWESPTVSPVLERAVADTGVPVVAASGNNSPGRDLALAGVAVPASYLLPNVVAVTAIDSKGVLAPFANYGANTIDLGAPGVAIVTTTVDDGYRTLSDGASQGTSFAAPFVSGALALGMSVEPTRSVDELVDTLLRTTTARPSLDTTTTSGGSLDAGAFLAGLAKPVCGRDRLPLAGFTDVPVASVHARSIDCIAEAGVTAGFPDGTYRPAGVVTRGQLATLLAGIVEAGGRLPADAPDAFVDDRGSVHEPAIDALAALGIVAGDQDDRFRPGDVVTRGQLAAMLVRTHAVLDGKDRTPSRDWFPDAADSVHLDGISIARDLGLVSGRDRVFFDVASATRRDQMGSTLARMLDSLAREGVALTITS